jgi:hypothetical protein
MTGLSDIERYDRGDLDGDGQNSILDFLMFKQLYVEAHGAAAFAAIVRGVPEPSATYLAVIGCLALMPRATSRLRRGGEIKLATTQTEG